MSLMVESMRTIPHIFGPHTIKSFYDIEYIYDILVKIRDPKCQSGVCVTCCEFKIPLIPNLTVIIKKPECCDSDKNCDDTDKWCITTNILCYQCTSIMKVCEMFDEHQCIRCKYKDCLCRTQIPKFIQTTNYNLEIDLVKDIEEHNRCQHCLQVTKKIKRCYCGKEIFSCTKYCRKCITTQTDNNICYCDVCLEYEQESGSWFKECAWCCIAELYHHDPDLCKKCMDSYLYLLPYQYPCSCGYCIDQVSISVPNLCLMCQFVFIPFCAANQDVCSLCEYTVLSHSMSLNVCNCNYCVYMMNNQTGGYPFDVCKNYFTNKSKGEVAYLPSCFYEKNLCDVYCSMCSQSCKLKINVVSSSET